MAMTWTDDQRRVIESRDRNLLVAAAAGSGKTGGLVGRINRLVTDEGGPGGVGRVLIRRDTTAG